MTDKVATKNAPDERANVNGTAVADLFAPPPGVSLDNVLCTDELGQRQSRPPDYETESRALLELTQHLAESPRTILQKLTDVALGIFGAGSAGVSLVSNESGDFYWPAISGAWAPFIGGGTPRSFGPCGIVLDRDAGQLFRSPEQYYPYLGPASPIIHEVLLHPFYVGGRGAGTVWVVSHEEGKKFDSEDLRLLAHLSKFASAAYATLQTIEELEGERTALRSSEGAAREARSELAERIAEVDEARRAALNLMEDSIEARGLAEQASSELREADLRFRNMADGAQVLIWQTDSEGINFVNRHYLKFFGAEMAEVEGMGWADFLHPDDADGYIAAYRDAFERADGYEYLCRFQRYDGKYRWLQNIGTPHFDADGSFIGFIGNSTDITDFKEAQAALIQSEEKFRNLFETIDEGFVIVEMMFDEYEKPIDYRFIEANPAFTRLTGLPEYALGRTARELVPDLEEFWFETYGKVALTGEPVRFENFAVPLDRWFNVHASRVGDASSRRVAIVFENITDRKSSELALRQSEERYRFLDDLGEATRTAGDPAAVMTSATRLLGEHLGVTRCAYADVEADNDQFTIRDDWREEGVSTTAGVYSLDLFGPRAAAELRLGRVLVVRDVDAELAPGEGADTFNSIGIKAIITCPLVKEGQLRAMMAVHNAAPRNWTDEEIALVRETAERSWSHIERIASSAALRESEERYRTLFDSIDEGFVLLQMLDGPDGERNHDYRYLQANPAFERQLGLAEPVGKTIRELAPDIEEHWMERFGRVADTGEPERFVEHSEAIGRWYDVYAARQGDAADRQVAVVFSDITERKRAEQALSESEERFSKAFNASPLVLTISSLETGKLLEVNDTFVEITGFAREEAIGKTTIELGLWSRPADREAELSAMAEEGQVRNTEYVFTLRDGREIVGLLSAERIVIGGETCALTVIHDVTERRQAIEKLRESEERFRNMADNAPVMVWVTDASGYCTFLSESWYEFTGQSPETARGVGWLDATHDDDKEAAGSAFFAATTERVPFSLEYRLRRADGEYRWAIDSARPRFSETGEFLGFVGSVIDITERKSFEDALTASEERFRMATDAVQAVIYDWDVAGDRVTRSRELVRLLGFEQDDPEVATNGWWRTRVYPDDAERAIERVKIAFREKSPRFEDEYRMLRRDGSEIWVNDTGLIIYNDAGEPVRCVGSVTDITERKRTEAALRESESRFRYTSDSAPVLIWMSDHISGRVWFNKPWLEYTGRSMDEEVGEGWAAAIHPDDVERYRNSHDVAFRGRRPYTMEYRLRRASGEYRWLLDRGVPRTSPDGEFLGYIGSSIDIHDRREAESALRRSEARLQLAMRVGSFGTWDLNYVDNKMIWSEKLFEIFGLPVTPDRSMSLERFAEMVHPDDAEKVFESSRKAREAHQFFNEEYRIVRADTGEINWVEAAAQFFYDSQGRTIRSVGVAQDITERKNTEEILRSAAERLSLAQEAGKVGIWDWDAATGRTYWSDQMWAFYGAEPGGHDSPNDFWSEHINPEDKERVDAAVANVLSTSAAEYKDEFRIVTLDGETRWLAVNATIVRDDDGTATRMYGVNLDVTERKAVAERIKSSEQQLRLITDSIPALVSYIDRDDRYRFVNKQYTEWFGKTSDEIVGQSMRELLGGGAYEALKPRIEKALSGETITFDTWLNYKNAGLRYVHVSYVPEFGANGEAAGYYALVSDLTEQKRAEDLLRSSEKRMQMLTESFTDYAIVSTDVEGNIDSWNPGAMNIFGYTEDEIVGRPADVLFTPEDVAKGVPEQEMRNAHRTGRAIDERWHLKKDGTRFYASGVMAPLYVGDTLTGYAKIAADLTERKRNAEALQRAYDEMEIRVLDRTRELASANESLLIEINERKSAERQKISLLQRIVGTQEAERRRIAMDLHDHLGQRLTALRLKLASLSDAVSDDEELHARATRLQQIAELIDSEVSFLAWELRPSALDELGLEEAIQTFVKEWSRHYEKRADFHSTGLGDLRLDSEMETQLYRITQEALNNIIKHAESQMVSVLLERTGDNIVLIIEDDGKGFDADGMLSSGRSGRGLGLFGMRERAELIGGTMDIESEPGRGTTVYVRIYLAGFTNKIG